MKTLQSNSTSFAAVPASSSLPVPWLQSIPRQTYLTPFQLHPGMYVGVSVGIQKGKMANTPAQSEPCPF